MNPLAIDVFSDVVCPWCYIGATRLAQAVAGLGDELKAEVCFHPFLLDPTVPHQGVNVPEMLRRKYGADPKQLWKRAEDAARESGLALDLSRQEMMYPTAAAHTLLRHAHERGTQPELSLALFDAYFQRALNIAEPSVLADVASRHGFDRDEALKLCTSAEELALTREEARSAAEGGIRGVPFFVFGGRLALSGAQPVTVLQEAMRRALDPTDPRLPNETR